jgi:L-rhamnose mutarotase
MQRVCFVARIRPGKAAEYRERHRAVWPEMREALRGAGWANYSLFLADSVGGEPLVVGYLETDDYEAAQRAMAQTGVNGRWQAEMAPFFADLGDRRPDEGFRRLDEIFHLD